MGVDWGLVLSDFGANLLADQIAFARCGLVLSDFAATYLSAARPPETGLLKPPAPMQNIDFYVLAGLAYALFSLRTGCKLAFYTRLAPKHRCA